MSKLYDGRSILESTMKKLSEKDKRALKLGGVCVAAVVMLFFVRTWLGHWAGVRESLAEAQSQISFISPSKAVQEKLLSSVPVAEIPRGEEEQMLLFRDKLNEQLKKAGIKSKPLKVVPRLKSQGKLGYKLLRVKCSGKGKLGQVFDLLANLKENPYLVAVEQFSIKCDPKKRQEVELDLTVSTFVK